MKRAVVSGSAIATPVTTEGVLLTLPLVPVPEEPGGYLWSHVIADAFVNFAPGAAATQVTFRVRRGTTIGGTQIGTSLVLPVPPTSTPAVPASTVNATNTNPYPVTVVITGGTGITNVSVNGSTVGTTAGTYVVPAGGTISITYATSPSWVWYGAPLSTTFIADDPVVQATPPTVPGQVYVVTAQQSAGPATSAGTANYAVAHATAS